MKQPTMQSGTLATLHFMNECSTFIGLGTSLCYPGKFGKSILCEVHFVQKGVVSHSSWYKGLGGQKIAEV